MTSKTELDRALGAWFESTAPTHAPSQLTDRILASTHGARPARTWRDLLGLGFRSPTGSHPIGTRAMVLIMAGAVLALLLGIVALGGGSSLRLGLGPTPSTQASPAPSSAAAGPVVVILTNLKPTLTVERVERQVEVAMEHGHVGLASGPIVVTKVTLLGPGDTYGTSGDSGSFTSDGLSWVVEVTGTHVVCSSFCDDAMAGLYRIDDATGYFSGGGHRPPFGDSVPSEDFRQLLSRNGLQYSPVSTPPAGILDAAKIVQDLDPHVFPLGGTLLGPTGKPYVGPLLGRLSIVDAEAVQATEVPFVVPPNGTNLIWWVQSLERRNSDEQFEWQAFDATTGHLLLSNVP